MKNQIPRLVILVIVLIWLIGTGCFIVDATEYAVVKRFGKPVATCMKPGLHFKLPAPIDSVQRLDNRLNKLITPSDESNMETLTAEGIPILYTAYALWRVDPKSATSPLQFIQSVATRSAAEGRMEHIINASIKASINKTPFTQFISDIPGAVDHDAIIAPALASCQKQFAKDYGIQLVDLRLRRLSLPETNRQAAFVKITAERRKIAREIRARGQREAREINSEAERKAAEILAQAGRTAEELRGKGRAEAAAIWNEAHARHPRFSEYWLKLQALDKSMDENTTLVLPNNLGFLDEFWNPPSAPPEHEP